MPCKTALEGSSGRRERYDCPNDAQVPWTTDIHDVRHLIVGRHWLVDGKGSPPREVHITVVLHTECYAKEETEVSCVAAASRNGKYGPSVVAPGR